MNKGDIVLITFPFTDLKGSKLRPAVVLADTDLDLTVCFITTQIQWEESTDVLLLHNPATDLKNNLLSGQVKLQHLTKLWLKDSWAN